MVLLKHNFLHILTLSLHCHASSVIQLKHSCSIERVIAFVVCLSSSGTELPLMIESYGLLNDIFPFSSILDAGYPIFNLHLANVLFDVILPSVLGSFL